MPTTLAKKTARSQTTPPSIFSMDPFNSIRSEFDQMLSHWFGDSEKNTFLPHTPSLDLNETDKAYEVKIDLPGVKSEELRLQFSDNVLTVSGERKCEKCEEEKNDSTPHRVERFHGTFSRSVVMPGAVDQDKIDAEYLDGVLKVTLPKAADVKPRQISIKS